MPEAGAEAGLFAEACAFVAAAARREQLPRAVLPEVAFAGRSNVGKSSLINALTGRKTLARTSRTPGRTRQIIFFDLGGRLVLVDLPGYGFSRAPKGLVRAWTALIGDYLRGRPSLRRVCLLVDSRHGPKESDREVMRMLDASAVGFQAVLTKCDKLGAPALAASAAALERTLATHPAAYPEVLATSARTGAGIAALRAALASLAAPAPVR